jgi:hypothetical protein
VLTTGGLAHFDVTIWACVLDERYVASANTTIEDIASTIVHEATHARLWRRGFTYSQERRSRIEAICFRRERAFAAKLLQGEIVRDHAERRLKGYSGQEYWTDEAFRARYEEGIVKAMEYLGVPKWLMPALWTLRWVSQAIRRMTKDRARAWEA